MRSDARNISDTNDDKRYTLLIVTVVVHPHPGKYLDQIRPWFQKHLHVSTCRQRGHGMDHRLFVIYFQGIRLLHRRISRCETLRVLSHHLSPDVIPCQMNTGVTSNQLFDHPRAELLFWIFRHLGEYELSFDRLWQLSGGHATCIKTQSSSSASHRAFTQLNPMLVMQELTYLLLIKYLSPLVVIQKLRNLIVILRGTVLVLVPASWVSIMWLCQSRCGRT